MRVGNNFPIYIYITGESQQPFIRPQLLFYPVITRTSSEFVVFANMQEKGAAVIIIC